MFWDPSLSPHILRLTAIPAEPASSSNPFCLSKIRCRSVVLEEPSGLQHVLFHDATSSLQLVVSGADVLRTVQILVEALFDPESVRAKLGALCCLNDLRTSGRLHHRHFPPEPRGQRLAVVLQALDGWLDGAPYREIAVALFGHDRVDTDWSDPGDHLRDHIRRAVRRGRALMEEGYRQFLR